MDLFAILSGFIILAAGALYVSRPLLQARQLVKTSQVDASALAAEQDALYTQIKELDMDHATGKVNDDDYTRLRAALVAQAADVLKQIEVAETAVPDTESDDVEALIAARRKPRSAPAATTSAATAADSDLEAAIAARRKTAAPVADAPVCPKCGKPSKPDDAFCAKCGTPLQLTAAQ